MVGGAWQGYSPWGLKEPDANEQLTIFFPQYLKSTMQAN